MQKNLRTVFSAQSDEDRLLFVWRRKVFAPSGCANNLVILSFYFSFFCTFGMCTHFFVCEISGVCSGWLIGLIGCFWVCTFGCEISRKLAVFVIVPQFSVLVCCFSQQFFSCTSCINNFFDKTPANHVKFNSTWFALSFFSHIFTLDIKLKKNCQELKNCQQSK